MDFPTALLRDLLHLSSSVELDEDELGARLAALVTALRAAVASYRGMYLTVVEGDEPVSLSAFHSTEDGAITTSLRLPFAALAPGFHVGSRVVFYAASPGAFVDLAADLAHALHAPIIFDCPRQRLTGSPEGDGQHGDNPRDGHESIVLDADLPPATLVSRLTGLGDASTINRAVGMLIDQGHHPDKAHATLHRHAVTPASNPTSMRRGCCDVDVAPARHARVAGRVVAEMVRCLSVRRSSSLSPPHTTVDAGQDGPLQAQALHRTAHADAFDVPELSM
ncbi:MAG TPA: hypothetical protein VF086_02235 [Propionibacteriaceae bacterium]